MNRAGFRTASTLVKKELPFQKRTLVNYSILQFKTMVLWNFDLQWKNNGTMGKELWYYGNNCGTIPKTTEIRFIKEKTC